MNWPLKKEAICAKMMIWIFQYRSRGKLEAVDILIPSVVNFIIWVGAMQRKLGNHVDGSGVVFYS